jgi:hypothetical protein
MVPLNGDENIGEVAWAVREGATIPFGRVQNKSFKGRQGLDINSQPNFSYP